jgi:hypothetical protein
VSSLRGSLALDTAEFVKSFAVQPFCARDEFHSINEKAPVVISTTGAITKTRYL